MRPTGSAPRSSWPKRGSNLRRATMRCRRSCRKRRAWFRPPLRYKSALAQRVAAGLQHRLQQIAENALAAGDDLRVGHHARRDRQPAADLVEIGLLRFDDDDEIGLALD